MVVVILGMLVCLVLAVLVLALVALPARRQGEVMFVARSDESADGAGQTTTDGTPARA